MQKWQVTIEILDDDLEDIEQLAEWDGKTIEEYISILIMNHLEENQDILMF